MRMACGLENAGLGGSHERDAGLLLEEMSSARTPPIVDDPEKKRQLNRQVLARECRPQYEPSKVGREEQVASGCRQHQQHQVPHCLRLMSHSFTLMWNTQTQLVE